MCIAKIDFWIKSFDNINLKCTKDLVSHPKATILIIGE